ncbi:MAG: hypothetical protein LBF44_00770, partial [Holosporaceae bacterium]|nr:hypothetical protein [Holosporaceae bacterium]
NQIFFGDNKKPVRVLPNGLKVRDEQNNQWIDLKINDRPINLARKRIIPGGMIVEPNNKLPQNLRCYSEAGNEAEMEAIFRADLAGILAEASRQSLDVQKITKDFIFTYLQYMYESFVSAKKMKTDFMIQWNKKMRAQQGEYTVLPTIFDIPEMEFSNYELCPHEKLQEFTRILDNVVRIEKEFFPRVNSNATRVLRSNLYFRALDFVLGTAGGQMATLNATNRENAIANFWRYYGLVETQQLAQAQQLENKVRGIRSLIDNVPDLRDNTDNTLIRGIDLSELLFRKMELRIKNGNSSYDSSYEAYYFPSTKAYLNCIFNQLEKWIPVDGTDIVPDTQEKVARILGTLIQGWSHCKFGILESSRMVHEMIVQQSMVAQNHPVDMLMYQSIRRAFYDVFQFAIIDDYHLDSNALQAHLDAIRAHLNSIRDPNAIRVLDAIRARLNFTRDPNAIRALDTIRDPDAIRTINVIQNHIDAIKTHLSNIQRWHHYNESTMCYDYILMLNEGNFGLPRVEEEGARAGGWRGVQDLSNFLTIVVPSIIRDSFAMKIISLLDDKDSNSQPLGTYRRFKANLSGYDSSGNDNYVNTVRQIISLIVRPENLVDILIRDDKWFSETVNHFMTETRNQLPPTWKYNMICSEDQAIPDTIADSNAKKSKIRELNEKARRRLAFRILAQKGFFLPKPH